MPKELIPRPLRRLFQESYSSYSIIREIDYDFKDAGLSPSDMPLDSAITGARRSLVERYYIGVDWSDKNDVARILAAWESHLQRLEDRDEQDELKRLSKGLKRAGFSYKDGRIESSGALPDPISAVESVFEGEHLWKSDHFRLFMSHVSSFKSKVSLLRKELLNYQISGFVAHEDIQPSKEWQKEIESALRSMDALVALLSSGFNESAWTDQEIGFALGRGVHILTVVRDIDPYGFIARRQGIIARGRSVPEVARAIFDDLATHEETRDKMATFLAIRLAASTSWDAARRNLELLESAGRLNLTDKQLLEKAFYDNSELRHAWGVPERLSKLIGKELPVDEEPQG